MDKLGYTDGVKERQSFVDELLAYINENYAEDITLSSMAEHFGYSKYYFSRMFNAALGTSLTDYVSAVRMMRALDLMRRTGCTVSGGGFGERFQQPAHLLPRAQKELCLQGGQRPALMGALPRLTNGGGLL